MKASLFGRGRAAIGPGLVVLIALGGTRSTALGLTPDSPQVKDAIQKAITYLESESADDKRVGARALVGLVLLKNKADPTHPKVAEAVKVIEDSVKGREPAAIKLDIYSAGLSIIFLVTLDPSAHSGEIQALLDYLKFRQKPHGGWGYPERETGDTSMTQYGVLSAWEARHAGFNIPQEEIEAVTNWLVVTQDPTGGFGYQGTIPTTRGLVKQKEVRHSMSAAGSGSIYICADLLGLTPRTERRDESLPSALKEVKDKPAEAAAKANTTVDPRRLKHTQFMAHRWLVSHYDAHPKDWTFYYLYALERYHSFRELADGTSEKEPGWYTDGARFLVRTQEPSGCWSCNNTKTIGRTADTAFATLFLLRSSKKSIEQAYGFGNSTLVLGRGLPSDTANVMVLDGKVVPAPPWHTAASLLPVLEQGDATTVQRAFEALCQLPPEEGEIMASRHPDLLRRLSADKSPVARVAAVRAMGNGANLDLVPTLIYAIGDPEASVARQACDALRRLTRSPGGAPLTQEMNESGRRDEIRHWKDWYLAIRPDAELDD